MQIMRDPSALAIAFLLPAILLWLFGYGVTLDARRVPLGIVVDQPGALATSFVAGFDRSRYFAPHRYPGGQAAERAMAAGKVSGIVWLRADFGRQARTARGAPVGIVIDGVDANTARLVEGYVRQVWALWVVATAARQGTRDPIPLDIRPLVRFNRSVNSRHYLIPGLIALIMTLTGALLTALVIAREWERGTMEALMVTPVTLRDILIAKLVPYFALGMGGMFGSVAIAVLLFGVPLRGSIVVLTFCAALFMLATLGMGLVISTVARNQFVAGQIALITTFLPAFILSGFVFDLHSTPGFVQAISHVVAARYFIAILQSIFLAGDVWSVILPNAASLALLAAIFLALARALARKRLD
ncbi:MAG TPA: ABC transporter permease [Acidiphilium sp.]|nr:ABC transporter permease [Acidiphilium sp.]